ncbi:uncharacterized protein JCM15063_002727 [Sporobolomyces koalae]|uniref:uncharacterized protein n=1 Tax=Sporobolomyces koalae TaxID=500713 RepID=UPI003175A67F
MSITHSPTAPSSKRRSAPKKPPRSSESQTSSVGRSSRKGTAHDEWATDDDDEPTKRVPRATKQSGRTKRLAILQSVFNLAASTLRAFGLLLPFALYLLPFVALFFVITYLRSLLYSYIPVFPSFEPALAQLSRLSIPLQHLPSVSLAPLTCAILGRGCSSNYAHISRAVRTTTFRAQNALTVFDHLLKLGSAEESTALALHPVEIWELATAIRYSRGIEDRAFISTELASLGDSMREVKDSVIDLNAQGMSAFTWIVHEFTRLENAISQAALSPTSSPKQQEELTKLLDSLFDRISTSLNDLLASLDQAIPTAARATEQSKRIFDGLEREKAYQQYEIESRSWIKTIADLQGGKGKQLRRDLDLTMISSNVVSGVSRDLEQTRYSLREYQANVGHFSAGMVGFHLSANEMSVEEEVNSLKIVMDEMKATLAEARVRARGKPKFKEIGVEPVS